MTKFVLDDFMPFKIAVLSNKLSKLIAGEYTGKFGIPGVVVLNLDQIPRLLPKQRQYLGVMVRRKWSCTRRYQVDGI